MTPKRVKTVTMPREKAINYLKKSEQFFDVMNLCLIDEEWDAVTLNGVHAAISITDALLIQRVGLHSISPKHDDAVVLLRQHFLKAEMDGNETRLSKILNLKNLVSYQPDMMQENKARQFAKDVERYFNWARKMLHKLGLR